MCLPLAYSKSRRMCIHHTFFIQVWLECFIRETKVRAIWRTPTTHLFEERKDVHAPFFSQPILLRKDFSGMLNLKRILMKIKRFGSYLEMCLDLVKGIWIWILKILDVGSRFLLQNVIDFIFIKMVLNNKIK